MKRRTWCAALLASCSVCPALADDILAAVQERLARLDKLVIDVTTTGYVVPLTASPLDRSHWQRRTHPNDFVDRLTIVRPNVLHEELTDTETYVPTIASIHDGVLTRRHVRVGSSGRVAWQVSRRGLNLRPYDCRPLLSMFDVHLDCSPITQLNIARLFAEYPVACVRTNPEFSTYAASVPMRDDRYHYEFDVNARGTPLRIEVRPEFRNTSLRGVWTLHTLRTQEVNGAELATEAVSVSFSPDLPETPWYTLWHFRVTSVAVRPELDDEAVTLAFNPRNATVSDVTLGEARTDMYDGDGNLIESIPTRFLLTPEEEAQYASAAGGGPGPAARPGAGRTWVPVLAAGGGIAAAVVLGLARPRKAA